MADSDPKDDAPLPALRRDLEAVPIEHEGQPLFLLQDHEGISGKGLAVSAGGMLVASLLNGQITASELRAAFAKTTGNFLDIADLRRIVAQLEKASLLETQEVRSKRRRILEEFLASPARKAMLAGERGYPDKTLELAGYLGKFFRDAKGPGKALAERPTMPAPPVCLVSPHIDLHRGGPAYAWAYGALAEAPPPDLIVALGVAHASPNSPWAMTRKAYETPYGPMSVDAGLYDEIREELWYDPAEDEWVHRKEHSLEFQALWLRFLWRDKTPPWVPILTSAFERFCTDKPPSSAPALEGAIRKIGERLAKRAKSQRILILAGVDLAHVGPRFGDDIKLGPETEKRIEAEDRRSLDLALKLDADAFYLSVTADDHWRKVCGLSALYTALRWTKALRPEGAPPGELLAYGQAPDPAGGIVSFTSAIFR